jgi:hypothetical protein
MARCRVVAGAALVSLLALAACKHDLDKLRAGRTASIRDAGTSGSGGGAAGGNAGRAGSAGADGGPVDAGDDSGAAGGDPADVCQPSCPEVESGGALELRSCCRGVGGRECGLTFGAGAVCLPMAVPGQADSMCTGVTVGGMRFQGCCRPDGRCGLEAGATGLGCVAREFISEQLGDGTAEPVACHYQCEADEDCNGVPGGFVCAEDASGDERFCANDCSRDRDCPAEFGQVCGFSNDFAMNRVLAICRPPVGDVEPGEACTAAEDCVHGVCLMVTGREPYCTDFCRSNADCVPARPTCFTSNIQRPDGGTEQEFSICRK